MTFRTKLYERILQITKKNVQVKIPAQIQTFFLFLARTVCSRGPNSNFRDIENTLSYSFVLVIKHASLSNVRERDERFTTYAP